MVKKRRILQHLQKWLDRDEIVIISGPRRVGKTSLLMLIENELLSRGIKKENIFMLNLEDLDVLQELNRSPKELLKFILNKDERNYFLIDEIQYLEEPTNFLKFLFDFYKGEIKLFVTGSFLFEMKGHFRDSLVGRKIGFNLLPLTFAEFLEFREVELRGYLTKENIPDSVKNELLSLLNEYLIYGGLPEIVLTEDHEIKKSLLKEYVFTYLKKDIRYISGGNDILRHNDLLSILANQISGLLNIEEICNTLGMTRRKTENYLQNFILSSLIYVIPPYFTNIRTQVSKMKKVFLFDTGVRNQVIQNYNNPLNRNDAGALFENFILNELIFTVGQENIYYFRSKVGSEIDFIIKREEIIPVEVKYKKLAKIPDLRGLANFIKKNGNRKGFLVNLTFNREVVEKRTEITDVFRFLNILQNFE